MKTSRILLAFGLVMAAGMAGCADDESTNPVGPVACAAGATQACGCPDGGTGTQTCDSGVFGECNCSSAPADAGGDGSADASDTGTKDGAAADSGGGKDGGADGGGTKDGGGAKDGGNATACTTDAECQVAGACPPDSTMGCGCRFNPQNEGKCAPLCSADTDCVQKPGETIICSKEGFCAPDKSDGGGAADGATDAPPPQDSSADGPPPPEDGGNDGPKPPTSCTTDTDCAAAGVCPADAKLGCGCRPKDGGQATCAPKCLVDADCPSSGQPLVCEPDEYCGPA